MDKFIYVCTDGCYSDYSIRAVFDNKGLAETFAERFSCTVEEWPLNPHAKGIKKGHSPYFVRITRDGEATEVREECSGYGFSGAETHSFDWQKNMCTHCFAKDETHAVKIANERRAAIIAANQWPA